MAALYDDRALGLRVDHGRDREDYVPASADVNLRLGVQVTATNAGGTGIATSNATVRVRA